MIQACPASPMKYNRKHKKEENNQLPLGILEMSAATQSLLQPLVQVLKSCQWCRLSEMGVALVFSNSQRS